MEDVVPAAGSRQETERLDAGVALLACRPRALLLRTGDRTRALSTQPQPQPLLFSILRHDLVKLPRPFLNLESSCLGPPRGWDHQLRHRAWRSRRFMPGLLGKAKSCLRKFILASVCKQP